VICINKKDFLNKTNWSGSYFQLAIEYSNRLDDKILMKIIRSAWEHMNLEGPWLNKLDFGSVPCDLTEIKINTFSNYLYGTITLPEQNTLGCLSLTVREEGGVDWLVLCVPIGMLELNYDINYPLIPSNNPCIDNLEKVYIDIAQKIFDIHPFSLAIIGEEVSGILYEKTLTSKDVLKGGLIINNHTYERLQPQSEGIKLTDELWWYPNIMNAFGA
jgi:hypothetical protein